MDHSAFMPRQAPSTGTVIALGGTGMIGRALHDVAQRRGLSFLSLSLDPDARADGFANLQLDFATAPEGAIAAALEQAVPAGITIPALCIIAGLSPSQIAEVAGFAARRGVPLAQISSCLLYRAEAGSVVDESTATLTEREAAFPYLRLKLAEEAALTGTSCDWRLLRTNHILGQGGLLGCIPGHNRDPRLLDHLRSGSPLHLARGGQVRVSVIHAEDLAAAMLDFCADPSTRGQILNVVHPEPVMADAYFRQLAALLGLAMPAIAELQPEPEGFWALTARDIHFTSRHPAVGRLSFRHDLISALWDTLSVDEAAYAALGSHMQGRLNER
jgi:nucleoside-diphosphate-sugar epimerase